MTADKINDHATLLPGLRTHGHPCDGAYLVGSTGDQLSAISPASLIFISDIP